MNLTPTETKRTIAFVDEDCIRQGIYIKFLDNYKQQLSLIGHYVDGKKNGRFIYYHPNGQVMTKCHYHNDNYHGHFKCYTEWGKLRRYKYMCNDRIASDVVVWHDNGQVREHICYKNGVYHGERKMWKADGSVHKHQIMKCGSQMLDLTPRHNNPEMSGEEKLLLSLTEDIQWISKPSDQEYYESLPWDI